MADPRRSLHLRVTCPCGESISVRAGSTATCPCGRAFDTADLPAADVAGLRSSVQRLRRRQARFVLTLLLAVAMLLLLRTSMPRLVLVPVFVLLWLQLCRPWWQARRRPTVTGAPTWSLRPVQPSPVQPSPVQPSPVQPSPVQPSPVQPSPVQPVERVPRDERETP